MNVWSNVGPWSTTSWIQRFSTDAPWNNVCSNVWIYINVDVLISINIITSEYIAPFPRKPKLVWTRHSAVRLKLVWLNRSRNKTLWDCSRVPRLEFISSQLVILVLLSWHFAHPFSTPYFKTYDVSSKKIGISTNRTKHICKQAFPFPSREKKTLAYLARCKNMSPPAPPIQCWLLIWQEVSLRKKRSFLFWRLQRHNPTLKWGVRGDST